MLAPIHPMILIILTPILAILLTLITILVMYPKNLLPLNMNNPPLALDMVIHGLEAIGIGAAKVGSGSKDGGKELLDTTNTGHQDIGKKENIASGIG
jgi:hypothetical protein